LDSFQREATPLPAFQIAPSPIENRIEGEKSTVPQRAFRASTFE
jgi:hypothetical protein